MKIYTGKGDKGETMTGEGKVVLKCDFNIEAVGDIDELSAVLGLINIKDVEKIQEDLLVIGAFVSGIKNQESRIKNLELRTEEMESAIDKMWKDLPELKYFIIFGGDEKASHLFFARAVCRRAERSVVALLCPAIMPPAAAPAGRQPDYNLIIKYLNRLSDYLFCLGRWENFKAGVKEKIWKSD